MNCASLEAMLADLVWIEEKKEPLTSAQFILFLILGQVCLVLILVWIVHHFLPPHLRRLKWILKSKPNVSVGHLFYHPFFSQIIHFPPHFLLHFLS